MNSVLIRVPLLPLGLGQWRLVEATPGGDGLLQIQGEMPQGERWQFRPGEFVEYDTRTFADGTSGLAATRIAVPEYRQYRITHAVCGILLGPFIGVYFFKVFFLYIFFGNWSVAVALVSGGVVMGVCSYLWGERAWTYTSEWVRRWWPLYIWS